PAAEDEEVSFNEGNGDNPLAFVLQGLRSANLKPSELLGQQRPPVTVFIAPRSRKLRLVRRHRNPRSRDPKAGSPRSASSRRRAPRRMWKQSPRKRGRPRPRPRRPSP